MKVTDKQLNKVINHLIQSSFNASGDLQQEKVKKNIKEFKNLPDQQAIQVASEYLKRLKMEVDKTTLEIYSALPLSNDEIKQIRDAVKADHKVTQIRTVVNQDLIGGIKVRIGDAIFDDTVVTKILQLGDVIRA